MGTHARQHNLTRGILFFLALILALAFALGLRTPAYAATSDGCLGPVKGQHIYDCAHLLTPSEITTLESDAAAVEGAGAPTIVYLQVRNATAQQTWQDAVDLMNRWNVESTPGAHDGFVMFFDLQPGNLRHGEVALFAGDKHYQHGNLPQAELDRIRTDVMTPLLANGQTAEGIAAGLQMVHSDLLNGPPPPPAPSTPQAAASPAISIPFNLLAALLAGLVALLVVRLTRQAPLGGDLSPVTLASPGDLPPAMAGALVQGRVSDAQIEATVLDFARRGLLVIEPTGAVAVQMRLVRDPKNLTGYEQQVWNELDEQSIGDDRVISGTSLGALREDWSRPKAELSRELTERGWYDPEGAQVRRRPLYIAGMAASVGVAIGLLLVLFTQSAWPLIGTVICLVAALAAFVYRHQVPETTAEGLIAAAPWRAYSDSVAAQSYEPNLDADLPYIVALGLRDKLAPRLKAASERGYAPAWFRPQSEDHRRTGAGADTGFGPLGFYPYWIAFHASMAPVPIQSSTGGSFSGSFSGGGAAGGGGGSAGGF